MMGSPAQVCDDDNAQNNTVVTNSEGVSSTSGLMAVVPEQSNNVFLQSHPWLKHEAKIKNIKGSTKSSIAFIPGRIGPFVVIKRRKPIDPDGIGIRSLVPGSFVFVASPVVSDKLRSLRPFPSDLIEGPRKPINPPIKPRNPGPGTSILVIQNGPNPNTPVVASPTDVNSNNNRPDAVLERKPIKIGELTPLMPTDPPRRYEK